MSITQIGLLLDIAGCFIIFFFGLPQKPQETDEYTESGPLTTNQIKTNKRITFVAYVGLFFLTLGFVFQFIGSFTFAHPHCP